MLLQTLVTGILVGSVYALIAVTLTLIWGIMHLINFAHGAYLMISMYLCYAFFLWFGFDPIITLPIAVITLFLLGVLTYKALISRIINSPLLFQIIATVALNLLVVYIFFLVAEPTFRSIRVDFMAGVLRWGGICIDEGMLLGMVACILALVFLHLFLHHTKTGKGIRATTDNPKAALALGINIEKMYALSWGIGMGLVAVAGSMLSRILYVYPTVGEKFALLAFAAVVLGGAGSIYGAFWGGITIGIFSTVAGVYAAPWMKLPAIYVIFILVLLLRPQGLFGKKRER